MNFGIGIGHDRLGVLGGHPQRQLPRLFLPTQMGFHLAGLGKPFTRSFAEVFGILDQW